MTKQNKICHKAISCPGKVLTITMATVKLFASLRELAGEKEFSTEATTIKEMLRQAGERYGPEFADRLKITTVLVNGNNIAHLQWKNTRLRSDDVVSLFPPLGGG